MAAVTLVGPGMYRVERDGRQSIVYVAGSAGDLWAFFEGQVYREQPAPTGSPHERPPDGGSHKRSGRYELTAPMPATVVKVLVTPGQTVRHGDTLVVLEAMKMELPLRAPSDGTVAAVHCREGELVQPERTLVELT